jgi:hypothetical protein
LNTRSANESRCSAWLGLSVVAAMADPFVGVVPTVRRARERRANRP